MLTCVCADALSASLQAGCSSNGCSWSAKELSTSRRGLCLSAPAFLPAKYYSSPFSITSAAAALSPQRPGGLTSVILPARKLEKTTTGVWRSFLFFTSVVGTSATNYTFAEPSITAGEVEEYGKQIEDQELVLNYLRSEGIDSEELRELELPESVEIVKERVQFLKQIGLTVKDINDYPLMLCCSVRRNLVPVLNYLESLRVTSSALPVLVRRYPQILHTSVVVDLQPHVTYLEGYGIPPEQLGDVLTRFPEVFGLKIEGTMSTSIAYLVMIGVNPRQIGAILTEIPQLLSMRVGNNLKPKVDFLTSLGIPISAVAKMIEKRPSILGFGLFDKYHTAVDSLLEIGVRKEAVAQLLLQFPDVLGLDVKAKLEEKLLWLTEEVGISEESLGPVLEKLPQILVINVAMARKRIEFLLESGFLPEDVKLMISECPQLLAMNIEKTLKPNLSFLNDEMKRQIEEVVEFPLFLTYNLDKRIRPRYEQMRQKCSLAWMLDCSDRTFEERSSLDYIEMFDETDETVAGSVEDDQTQGQGDDEINEGETDGEYFSEDSDTDRN
jgi:mTERF domain-containing protein